ncbi:MAG TPA: hypothetical protein VIP46_02795 [Pyrinomonadaceae bacterium]
MSGLVLKARTLAELIDAERAPSDEPKRQLPALHDVFNLCFRCTLPECDENNPDCRLRVESRDDKKLRDTVRYQLWLEKNIDRRSQKQREGYERKKAQRAAGKSTSASRGAALTPNKRGAGDEGTGRPLPNDEG